MKRFFIILALLIITAGTVRATPSTHIWGPSTDIQPYMKWHVTSDMYVPVETLPGGAVVAPVTNLGLTVGVLPFETVGLELGVDHKGGLGVFDRTPMYFNAKFGTPEGAVMPALAVGAYDIGTKTDATDFNVLYGKVAKTVKISGTDLGRLSVGYFMGNDKLLLDAADNIDSKGLMAAWERTVTEASDKLWVCVEYMGTESAYGSMNYGFSWKFSPNVALLLGYDIPNNTNLPATMTVQVDMDF
jgi:hypothetical protein